MYRVLLHLLVVCALSIPAFARDIQAMGFEGDWSLFRDGSGAGFACWIATNASTRTGPRDQLLLTVTQYSKGGPQVSIFSRSPLRKVNAAGLSIDGQRFRFQTEGTQAWASNRDSKKIVEALTQSAQSSTGEVLITWQTEKSIKVSVHGFSKAYQRNIEECPKGR